MALPNMSFSKREIHDLMKAWIIISIVFAMVMSGSSFFVRLFISAVTVGLGFMLHELGHKLVAQQYGAWAEFRAIDRYLMFSLILAFFGIIFVAPGAVMIKGRTIGRTRTGKIAAAGPIMNYLLSFVFLAIALTSLGIVQAVALFGATVNAFLGLFNMIPFLVFDGKKILQWNKGMYALLVSIGLLLLFFRPV